MNRDVKFFLSLLVIGVLTSCASKKSLQEAQLQLDSVNKQLGMAEEETLDYKNKYQTCEGDKTQLQTELALRKEQLADLKGQVADLKSTLNKQISQVGDLTVLSQSANDNIKVTLDQLKDRDKYIKYLQLAKTKTDSINLALAVNLKSVLRQGIDDEDVQVQVDKTVVFINLSDKMLYTSGSSSLTPRAKEVLGKIASILESKPGFEVMVEGYTDDRPIKRPGISDNWDLSVLRATSVVRVLQEDYKIDPNRLIAAGRGQYNALASNETDSGRATNRRTRIIILPKLGEFYDLLEPGSLPDE